MNDTSVGNTMQKGKENAIKALIGFFGILVYTAGILYAEVHGYALLIRGVDPSMVLWATVGIVALGITALVLPLGLHYKFHAPLQRIAAFAFYGIDLALLFFNSVVDYSTRTGGALPGWLTMYMTYAMPATPIIAALGWSLLWILDPAQKLRAMIETTSAAATETLMRQIEQEAKSADISADVQAAAAEMARDVIRATLGTSTASTRLRIPARVVDGKITDNAPRHNEEEKKRVRNPGAGGRWLEITRHFNQTAPAVRAVEAEGQIRGGSSGSISQNGSGSKPADPTSQRKA